MLMIALSLKRYLAISLSDFCVASCILLFETNPVRIVGSGNLNQIVRDHEALLGFQQVFTWFDEDTCGDNNKMVVG